MYRTVAGIDTKEEGAGYKEIVIHPIPGGGLSHASGSIDTYYGKVSSQWKIADGKFSLEVEIPANTTATIHIPRTGQQKVSEGGKPVNAAANNGSDAGYEIVNVGSGKYQFVAE